MESTPELTLNEWLLALRETHGKLTPDIVREAARPAKSPAHGFVFGLKPGEAAEEYYLLRAHRLIQSVRFTTELTADQPPRRVRFWYAVPGDGTAYVYEPIDALLQDKAKFTEARNAAVRRLHDAETAIEDLDIIAKDPTQHTRTRAAIQAVQKARALVEADS